MTMYTVLAYLAMFRLDELGFVKFKEFALTQDPSKVFNFASYLFNKENLWNCLRAEWMKVRDLSYVEDELIAGVEQYIPELSRFCADLDARGIALAAAQAEKEEAFKTGSVGLAEVQKRGVTRPISPNITKPRPHPIPLPEKISTKIVPNEVPGYLNRTSLDKLAEERAKSLEAQRQTTQEKYPDKFLFNLATSKAGMTFDEIKAEVEEERRKDLAFDSSYVNAPPDFSKIPAKIRLNAASVLREDYLYRKQQAKDADILRNYEKELRDPVEYFAWQAEMKERDAQVKLEQVALRREESKASAEEAKAAVIKQQQDNKTVAEVMKLQAQEIAKRRALEAEIAVMQNQVQAQIISSETEAKLKAVKEKIVVDRTANGKKLRKELEASRLLREEENRKEEERRADRIRQLRALDMVPKPTVVVFDPTKVAGTGVLDEMSYMEMKERLQFERIRAEEAEIRRRADIIEAKEKKAVDLESRTQCIMRARSVKQEAAREQVLRKQEKERLEKEAKEKARAVAAQKLDRDLTEKREQKRAEVEALKAEEERVRRQQQYLGVAAGLVEETRAEQQQLGLERETRAAQLVAKTDAIMAEMSRKADKANRLIVRKKEAAEKVAELKLKEQEAAYERAVSVAKVKASILSKKVLVREGRDQHERTARVAELFNPYAATMNAEIHQRTLKHTMSR
jgi:hypothetical protein